jgi:hypothetical protein
MIREMQQWVQATERRMTEEGSPDAALIYGIDRPMERAVGYCWGCAMPEIGATERKLWWVYKLDDRVGDLDRVGWTLASEVWKRAGCVIVSSVWAGGTAKEPRTYKERRFRAPDEKFEDKCAWMINMALLGRNRSRAWVSTRKNVNGGRRTGS